MGSARLISVLSVAVTTGLLDLSIALIETGFLVIVTFSYSYFASKYVSYVDFYGFYSAFVCLWKPAKFSRSDATVGYWAIAGAYGVIERPPLRASLGC